MSSGAATLFIATPTADGLMLADYVASLARMMRSCTGAASVPITARSTGLTSPCSATCSPTRS